MSGPCTFEEPCTREISLRLGVAAFGCLEGVAFATKILYNKQKVCETRRASDCSFRNKASFYSRIAFCWSVFMGDGDVDEIRLVMRSPSYNVGLPERVAYKLSV